MKQENSFTLELLPHNRPLRARKGNSILETLIDNSILLRSDCGGKGVCGKCRIDVLKQDGTFTGANACACTVKSDMSIRIPQNSLLSAHIISKASVELPQSFLDQDGTSPNGHAHPGIAVDLGTTTIAIYLCDIQQRSIISSISVKNPQTLYGDDVISRIYRIGQNEEQLGRLQQLVVRAIEWGIKQLGDSCNLQLNCLQRMVVVGNPTMIHILLGVSPWAMGVYPYQPQFYSARITSAKSLQMNFSQLKIYTLPQVSGFLGGDILAAALGAELTAEPPGTLLIDLGTNGELLLKGKDAYYATSCATGPAFEGAALSCGVQAVPGAIDRIRLENAQSSAEYSVITQNVHPVKEAIGICGSGILSGVSALRKANILLENGYFNADIETSGLLGSTVGNRRFVIVPQSIAASEKEISISQKDIRAVQLGKAALMTGIEFLLKAAGIEKPDKIIVALFPEQMSCKRSSVQNEYFY